MKVVRISIPNYQQKITPLVIVTKFQMETYTWPIEKIFTKIIANYYGETTIPPMNLGKELGGKDLVYLQGASETHHSQMLGENPYQPLHRRNEGTSTNNEVKKSTAT